MSSLGLSPVPVLAALPSGHQVMLGVRAVSMSSAFVYFSAFIYLFVCLFFCCLTGKDPEAETLCRVCRAPQ